MVGAVPSGFAPAARPSTCPRILPWPAAPTVAPLEMTKWFDTNYHYLVPEFEPRRRSGWIDRGDRRLQRGPGPGHPHPAGAAGPGFFPLAGQEQVGRRRAARAARALLPVYEEVSAAWPERAPPGSDRRAGLGPGPVGRGVCGCRRPTGNWRTSAKIKICLATYFGGCATTWPRRCGCRWRRPPRPGPLAEQLEQALESRPQAMLSLGVIDGRNIWRADSRAFAHCWKRLPSGWGPSGC